MVILETSGTERKSSGSTEKCFPSEGIDISKDGSPVQVQSEIALVYIPRRDTIRAYVIISNGKIDP